MRRALAALLVSILLALPAAAVQPDEVLDDPALEARARALSEDLRCLVCRNESIDESNADLARDLRLLVRERLMAGDTDAEVIEFLVARYGEYVLLRPTFSLGNAALWLAAPMLLLAGGGISLVFLRRRQRAAPDRALSPEERARLDTLMNGSDNA